jgi:crotonobetainyl-CoA:carnitine CoA-transferase CaiB-like acyl-CoA transferase
MANPDGQMSPWGSTEQPAGPLMGLRILDLSGYMSGPLVTLIAGDLGAEVLKVESIQRLDGWRGGGRGDAGWERAPGFNWIARNKRDITLNLTERRGADILRRLVADADALVENYTPRVMRNFGLSYEELVTIRPDLIMLSMPGFGGSGSWRDYTAFAWNTEELATICHLTGYEDSPPLFTGTTGGDPLAGLMGALALVAALNHRRRTGQGQHIDLSQVEAATSFMGDMLVKAQLSGSDPTRHGNRSDEMAPHGIYPCAGIDKWIAIACRSDEEWARLWREMTGALDSDDADGVWLRTRRERLRDVDLLNRTVADWTRPQDAHELMYRLQAAGVPAGAVLDGRDLLEDPHLVARGFHFLQERAGVGVKHYMAEPFHMSAPLPTARPAPLLGEHNDEILRGVLGLSDEEIEELTRDNVIGTAPLDLS